MSRLIHLNGPSGIGKSTIAQMYTEQRPGVLNLDIDRIVSLIGGWESDFWETFKVAQRLAISMAETHLRTGRDVIMPQLVTRNDDIAGFEAAVARCGAKYQEIVLIAEKQQALDRYSERVAKGAPTRQKELDEVAARSGGVKMVERIHGQITAFVLERPRCAVVRTDERSPAETYAEVVALVANADSQS